jgi:hypothetical protein
MKKLLIVFLLLGSAAKADIEADKYKHLGVSYGIQLATYEFYKNAFQMDQVSAVVFSGFTTFLGTACYSLTKNKPDRNEAVRDHIANSVGMALGIGTIFAFDL